MTWDRCVVQKERKKIMCMNECVPSSELAQGFHFLCVSLPIKGHFFCTLVVVSVN